MVASPGGALPLWSLSACTFGEAYDASSRFELFVATKVLCESLVWLSSGSSLPQLRQLFKLCVHMQRTFDTVRGTLP
jgi:hypothetical protein